MLPRISTITSCFHGERYLGRFLANVAEQTAFAQLEVVLAHNEPSAREIEMVRAFQQQYPGRLQHLIVEPVESLGASWNRCWREAQGEYVCIWNIDDRRTPDSIARQCAALDAHPEAPLVYGDQLLVYTDGSLIGWRERYPAYDREVFTRCFFLGAFPMWRKALGTKVGYFDEQLRSANDYDFAVRLALRGPLLKIPGILGYFTDIGLGLSTGNALCAIERTVVELRYGVYDTVDVDFLDAAQQYRIDALQFGDAWHPVQAWVPGYADLLAARAPLHAVMEQKLAHGQPAKARQQADLRLRKYAKMRLVQLYTLWARLRGRPVAACKESV
ncbi:MAG TPA: glycosyltransferase [Armatimonadota bacterium]